MQINPCKQILSLEVKPPNVGLRRLEGPSLLATCGNWDALEESFPPSLHVCTCSMHAVATCTCNLQHVMISCRMSVSLQHGST